VIKSSRLLDRVRGLLRQIERNAFLIGALSLVWFILRTGSKPSRAVYPCQRTAAANSYMWLTVYAFPFLLTVEKRMSARFRKRNLYIVVLSVTIVGSAVLLGLYEMRRRPSSQAAGLSLTEKLAEFEPSSDIFVINGTSGNDEGVNQLINLMAEHELFFYGSPVKGTDKEPSGLIGKDDVIIIKVNGQWDERGGTNTDLLKALIQAILNHPDGFIGEVIVADNGQAQYGSAGNGGSLAWSENNAEDTSQSVQTVVDQFAGSHKVSTYLWDKITSRRVNEYHEGDIDDGYVVNATANSRTSLMVSYPKFRTKLGTYVSLKLGIWDPQRQVYDSERLKVINFPVLKSHSTYGVTASVKHYMGVVSDKLTAQLGARAHNTIRTGGMGTEMVETRFPVLNIVDAIWVNAVPGAGPSTPYATATRINLIVASTDPVALDYWASKHILVQTAKMKGYGGTDSMDPDNTASGSFGHWLRLSMEEIVRAGYQATVDESHMNVYIGNLQSS